MSTVQTQYEQGVAWEKVPGGLVRLTSFRRDGIAHAAWFAMDSGGTATMHASRELAVAAIAPRAAATRPGAAPMGPGLPRPQLPARAFRARDEAEDQGERLPRRSWLDLDPPSPDLWAFPAPVGDEDQAERPSRRELPDLLAPPRRDALAWAFPAWDEDEDQEGRPSRRELPDLLAPPPPDLLIWDEDAATRALAHNGSSSRHSKTKTWRVGLAIVLFGVANAVMPFSNPSAEQIALPGNNLMAATLLWSMLDGKKERNPQAADDDWAEQPPDFD